MNSGAHGTTGTEDLGSALNGDPPGEDSPTRWKTGVGDFLGVSRSGVGDRRKPSMIDVQGSTERWAPVAVGPGWLLASVHRKGNGLGDLHDIRTGRIVSSC